MTITRRHFLETASLAVIAGTVLPSAMAQRGHSLEDDTFSPDRTTIFNGVSPKTFQSLIGEDFAVSLGGKSFGSLTLIEVNSPEPASPPKSPTGRGLVGNVPKASEQLTISFTLRFQKAGTELKQDSYTLNHPALGSFPLFIVSAGPGVDPRTYTAVFNRLA